MEDNYEEIAIYAENKFLQLEELFLRELVLLNEEFPDCLDNLPTVVTEGRQGRLLARYFRAAKNSEKNAGCASFYGHVFLDRRHGRLAASLVTEKMGSHAELFTYNVFQKRLEEGDMERLTPIELWEYSSLDWQRSREGHNRDEKLEKDNPYLVVFLQFLERIIEERKG